MLGDLLVDLVAGLVRLLLPRSLAALIVRLGIAAMLYLLVTAVF